MSADDLHWYYLHTNGDLIHKRFRPDPSDFVRRIWAMDPTDRGTGYIILIEAASMGARMNRVLELAKSWGMDGEDGKTFCERAGFSCIPTETEAGPGFEVRHNDDAPERTSGFGSSPLLALISYVRKGDFAQSAAA